MIIPRDRAWLINRQSADHPRWSPALITSTDHQCWSSAMITSYDHQRWSPARITSADPQLCARHFLFTVCSCAMCLILQMRKLRLTRLSTLPRVSQTLNGKVESFSRFMIWLLNAHFPTTAQRCHFPGVAGQHHSLMTFLPLLVPLMPEILLSEFNSFSLWLWPGS